MTAKLYFLMRSRLEVMPNGEYCMPADKWWDYPKLEPIHVEWKRASYEQRGTILIQFALFRIITYDFVDLIRHEDELPDRWNTYYRQYIHGNHRLQPPPCLNPKNGHTHHYDWPYHM